ncbi:hypothetical protein NQT69_15770 [Pseudoalteromonas shioyasakiensis]|uniref:hypothetical protein n=1 Tax=Pseudoalteromonas shioyasakiensis TaxID=1190813 RepID=UPI0021187696|nr:hypothetical protein [Pseudoalteromonas shioyasakiensis]MCQ8879459.1 hypothetical protein [Pseudoalteromonas shioyasakiensis]
MQELEKYKHYFIVVAALLLALYVTDPLWISYQELKQQNSMQQKRANKLAELLKQQQTLIEQLEVVHNNAEQILDYVFVKNSESDFKLTAQQLIEKTFNSAQCEIDRLGWQGQTPLNDKIVQWRLNVRFKGSSLCVLNVTKQLELLTPLVRFTEYNYIARRWEGKHDQSLTGDIDILMWNNKQPQPPEQEPQA